ncbi:intraflagellar transport protein 57 homolog isoform X1 [Hemibagrus wyckioides]|uniref:intraflagellar transport protein 57 homolog isoform X1 n=1 Tax=Hemibagrus wyckioides TaxID=337641 RepID=UPI00266CD75D|nr:intraflagellar transport protein 57 homolog isoform X1 [Hemibagrus wyckioides]
MADDGRREDEDDRSPGLQHQMFLIMEDLLDKLKLLDYEEQVLVKHNMKPLSRYYFVASSYTQSNPGEQFYMFSVIAAWLITLCGRSFETPQEYDDPNAIVSNILTHLRALGGPVEFPPSKLKSGSGEHVCYVLDRLAEEALNRRQFAWKRPLYPSEQLEEESVLGDDAELTLSKLEDLTEEAAEFEDVIDLEELKSRTSQSEVRGQRPEMILESVTDSAEWNLEVERVLPQLKVSVRTDIKDWRCHVSQMHQHQDGIKSSLKEAKAYLDKLLEEISKTQEKVSSREKYINTQLEHLITDYRNAQSKFCEAKELYQQASGGVTERTRTIAEISEELEKVKQEMDEKGSSMSDGVPVVKIRQSLTKLKQEIQEMDVRMGVVEHTLLQAKLKEKSNMTRDMHATHITETTTHTYS